MWMNKLDWLKWLNWGIGWIGWDNCMDWIGSNDYKDLIVEIAELVEMIG